MLSRKATDHAMATILSPLRGFGALLWISMLLPYYRRYTVKKVEQPDHAGDFLLPTLRG